MPTFNSDAPFVEENAAPRFDPSKSFTEEANAPRFDTTKSFTIEEPETRTDSQTVDETQPGTLGRIASQFSSEVITPFPYKLDELGTANEEAFRPSVNLPKLEIKPDDNRFVAAGKQLVNVATSIPEFFSSPAGAAAIGGGAIAPTATSALLTVDMLRSLGKQIVETYGNVENMTPAQMGEAAVNMVTTGWFARAAGAHAIKGTRAAIDAAKERIVPGSVEIPAVDTSRRYIEPDDRFVPSPDLVALAPETGKAVAEVLVTEKPVPVTEPVFPVVEKSDASPAPTISPSETPAPSPGLTIAGEPAAPKSGEKLVVEESLTTEMTGLGGATLAEVAPAGTAFKKSVADLERVAAGFPEEYPRQTQAMVPAWDRAGETLSKNPDAGKNLLDQLQFDPERGINGDEIALLLRYQQTLKNAKNEAASLTHSDDLAIKERANIDYEAHSQELLRLMDSMRFVGSQSGRNLRWFQALAHEDFSFETMRLDKEQSLGRKLNPEVPEDKAIIDKLKEHADRIAELERQLAEKEKAATDMQRTKAADEAIAEVGSKVKADKAGVETRDLVKEKENAIGNLKDRFIEQGDLVGGNTSIRKLMELLYDEGFTDRVKLEQEAHRILKEQVEPDITLQETQDLMSGYGKYKLLDKDPTKTGVRQIVGEIQSVRKLLDFFQGQAPSKTGQERQIPSNIKRQLDKVVAEAKKRFGTISTDPATALKSTLDAIETRLKNRITDLRQEISNRKLIVKEKSPTPYNEETLRLSAELETVLKEHRELFPKEPPTPEQRLKLAEDSAKRQIVEIQRQINSGEIFSKTKQTSEQRSATLDAAKARIEELKYERDNLRETIQPTTEPEARQLQQILTRLRNREAVYKERLAKGDFGKRVHKEQPSSSDVLAARARVESAKLEFNKGLNADMLARQSTGQKIWRGIKQARGAFLNIASSFDFSAPRQALTAILANTTRLITHPTSGKQLLAVPFGRMFKAWASEDSARIIEQRIKDRPNAKSGADKIAGIEYTDLDTNKFTRHEENAHSILDEWSSLPFKTGNAVKSVASAPFKVAAKGIRMSNRAFIAFLNSTRASLFDFLLETKYKEQPPTELDLEIIGNLVNVTTGRGSMKPMTAAAASEVIWAPKLLTSRLQLLTGQPLWTGKWAESGKARTIVAEEYARIIAGGFLLYTVSRAFDEKKEISPTSSDFGKIVRGNTRIDPWGGLQQVTVLGARVATGITTTLKGDERDIGAARKYGQRGLWHVLADFGRSKLRPDVGAAVDVITRSDFTGQPTTPAKVAESLLVPLPMREITDILKERGFTEGMIIEALGQFGAGVSNYEAREGQK